MQKALIGEAVAHRVAAHRCYMLVVCWRCSSRASRLPDLVNTPTHADALYSPAAALTLSSNECLPQKCCVHAGVCKEMDFEHTRDVRMRRLSNDKCTVNRRVLGFVANM